VAIWRVGNNVPVRRIATPSQITALSFGRSTLLIGSGTHVRLVDLATGRTKTFALAGGVLAAELDPTGQVFAVATRLGKSTAASILSAGTGHVIRPSTRGRDPFVRVQSGREAARKWQPRPHGPDLGRPHRRAPPRPAAPGLCPRRALLPRRPLARDLEPGRCRLRLERGKRAARAPARRRERSHERGGLQPGRKRDRDPLPTIVSRASTTARTAACSRRSRVTATRSRPSASTRAGGP